MLRIALFLLIVIFVVAIVLILKTIYDKSGDKEKEVETKDDLDSVMSSWEATDRRN